MLNLCWSFKTNKICSWRFHANAYVIERNITISIQAIKNSNGSTPKIAWKTLVQVNKINKFETKQATNKKQCILGILEMTWNDKKGQP